VRDAEASAAAATCPIAPLIEKRVDQETVPVAIVAGILSAQIAERRGNLVRDERTDLRGQTTCPACAIRRTGEFKSCSRRPCVRKSAPPKPVGQVRARDPRGPIPGMPAVPTPAGCGAEL
jgi:hypothetical protein